MSFEGVCISATVAGYDVRKYVMSSGDVKAQERELAPAKSHNLRARESRDMDKEAEKIL